MRIGRGDDGSVLPAYSTGWVARRLGVAPATLRTWQRRYAVGPTGRTVGGHRRYLEHDLDRLERMRRLMLVGLPTAEAARVSADLDSGPAAVVAPKGHRPGVRGRPGSPVRRLTAAAMGLDQPAIEPLLADAIRLRGVVPAWTDLILPVLVGLGERFARRGDCIAVEHLFTGCVHAALGAVTAAPRDWDGFPPVLLACPDQEQHGLALHALAAALAETGCPSRVLGASVPVDALVSAARRLAPRAVFLWAHAPETAHLVDLHALPPRRPSTPVVVGGPGWQDVVLPPSVTRVSSLAEAVAAVTHDVVGVTA